MPNNELLIEEREALRDLLHSPGWLAFKKYIAREYIGEGYFQRMGTALTQTDGMAPKVLHAISLELQRVLTWPEKRIIELKGVVE